ncbi:MAG TPA: 3-deoxy-D-manno-octulosonic acid transferase [Pyrinomonadaceae bacterium]|nr:3-deoxy-D-manno-octulosonic acid transferase [Pyrinomonadaceae bacterium]
MFFLYSFLLTIAFILLSPLLLIRSGKYLAGFWQRLGFLPKFDAEEKPVIWLHCVSVGETNAARPLVKELVKTFPNHKLVVSTTTRTGQKLAREVFKDEADLVFYFPYDWKFSVRRSLRKIKPQAVLLMETEIWFNFIREAGKHDVKVAIVNGRLSEKSARGYSRIPNTIKRVFHYVQLILAQTPADAKRFLSLGSRGTKILVSGNIKFDQRIDENDGILTNEFRERFGISQDAPLIVAASTHAPEEKIILEAVKEIWKTSTDKLPRLMLVPRHPERFDEVTQLIKSTGFIFSKRSENPSVRDKTAEIILLDSIGELRAVYPLAEIVFVGGSLIPHGGQNILEPAIEKKAIVTGFYTMNFKAIVEEFLDKDAVFQLPELSEKDASPELAKVFSDLLHNDKKRNELAENALKVAENNRGATVKTIESLKPLLDEAKILES